MKQFPAVEDWQTGGFGLYIHWPFCQSKCPYCDFNSHVSASLDQKRWEAAYLSEIERFGTETSGRVLQTVFFGGGTPSLMAPELVHAIISRIKGTWPTSNDLEITMEANPGSVESDRFRGYSAAGVNRVSIGVQALNDPDLKALGRLHDVSEAKRAIALAQSVFDRVSFDLIYARQNQDLISWKAELTEALSLASGHLSLYQLTIEDGTAFGDRFKRGLLRGLPNEDLGADMYLLTQELTEAAGYRSYEISNYAKSGHDAKHNCIYWNAGDYIGIGPGAHGRLTLGNVRMSTEAISNPVDWLTGVETLGSVEKRERIQPVEQGTEYLLMGLRRDTGIDLERYYRISGQQISEQKIDLLRGLGMVEIKESRLIATQQGRLVLNAVIENLME
ncbi:radical SAM family heme chaperone HemW [Pseudorhodobacter wandonensis]|uniref:radical SAM family heme chaperone HemW n=1 Tax=Pseudorhodobacter wandonensis TaxID=1120568 RepID=UPI00067DBB1E|nr:radical SAM family heme chaperone HemW [Pseudorhodobacter wandonensis]